MKKFTGFILALVMLLGLTCAASADQTYVVGSKMEDFTVTTYDGKTISLYETLEEKDLVLLNIWASWCTPCRREFPFLDEAYRELSDEMEIIAVSCEPSDSDEKIGEFAKSLGLTFPMGRDMSDLLGAFKSEYIPMIALINKSAEVVYIDTGAIENKEEAVDLIKVFLYKTPNVAGSSEAELEAALNAEGAELAFRNSADESVWPMVCGEKDGRQVVKSSNAGVGESTSSVLVTVQAQAGDALVVEFKLSSEAAGDLMSITVDNEPVKVFSGERDWMTYAYAFESDGTHEVEISYTKDFYGNDGEDAVWIDTISVLPASQAQAVIAKNPVYPTFDTLTFKPTAPNVQEVEIYDSTGYLAELFGEFDAYIVNDLVTEITVGLTDEIDPECACIYSDFDASTTSILTFEQGEDGYYRKTFDMDALSKTGFSFTSFKMLPDSDADSVKALLLFADEANAIAALGVEPAQDGAPALNEEEVIWWKYADGQEASSADESSYTVKFVDQTGAPVSGVMLQACSDDVCIVYFSDENGVCTFSLLPGTWEMHVLMLPEGYKGDTETVWTLAEGGEEIEITLEKQ